MLIWLPIGNVTLPHRKGADPLYGETWEREIDPESYSTAYDPQSGAVLYGTRDCPLSDRNAVFRGEAREIAPDTGPLLRDGRPSPADRYGTRSLPWAVFVQRYDGGELQECLLRKNRPGAILPEWAFTDSAARTSCSRRFVRSSIVPKSVGSAVLPMRSTLPTAAD